MCLIKPDTFAQINTARMDSLNIELNNATFKKFNTGKLSINLINTNFITGEISRLIVTVIDINTKDLYLNRLGFTLNNVNFTPERLIKDQELILKNPVRAKAYIQITETGINQTLNQPKVLEKLSNVTRTKIKKLGIELSGGLISFQEPEARILENNRIEIAMKATLSNLVGFPVKYSAILTLVDSKLALVNPRLNASGVTLPGEVTQILNNKLSELLDVDKRLKDDAQVNITDVKVIPGQYVLINGDAIIHKLRYSKKNRDK
jgi:hypothetical protein